VTGLPDFCNAIDQNGGKNTKLPLNYKNGHTIFQMAVQYSKWPYNIPNGHTIFKMVIIYFRCP
jgi:hypothetical protein